MPKLFDVAIISIQCLSYLTVKQFEYFTKEQKKDTYSPHVINKSMLVLIATDCLSTK